MSGRVSLVRRLADVVGAKNTAVGLCRVAARPFARLSSSTARSWPGVTNSASNFDPRNFLQSDGPHSEAEVAGIRRALLYRSRQTGWLETDLIMGRWAAKNLDKLSVPELQEYAKIVQVRMHPFAPPDAPTLRRAVQRRMWRASPCAARAVDLLVGRGMQVCRMVTTVALYLCIEQCEIMDIFQWINGQQEVPRDIDGPIMKQLQVLLCVTELA
jgi:succinate dehydrogenase flavin-adding protein (antitoxin of CptAB toxin-antitoxin module)